MSDNDKKIGITELGVLVIVLFLVMVSARYGLRFLGVIPSECTAEDVYSVGDFSECSEKGFKIRDVVKKNGITCLEPGKVERPDEKVECEYIPDCREESLAISDWSICQQTGSGFVETREIAKRDLTINCKINYQSFPTERSCVPNLKKKLQLLQNYTTEVDPLNISAPYKPSRDNFALNLKGKLKSLKLIITATTSYKIPEYYYFQFEINEEIPRTIGAERLRESRLNLNNYGIFKGTETPAKREFDLSKVVTANIDQPGSQEINYLDVINNRKSDILYGSLYVGDGRSMIVEDPQKRIFATITDAILEYECEDASSCEITSGN